MDNRGRRSTIRGRRSTIISISKIRSDIRFAVERPLPLPLPPSPSSISISRASKCRSYLVIFGCSLIMFCSDAVFSFGNLTPYLYLTFQQLHMNTNTNTNEEQIAHCTQETASTYESNIAQCNLFFAFSVAVSAIFLSLGGKLELAFNSRVVCFLAGTLSALGFLATYFALRWAPESYFLIFFTYSLVVGGGCGLGYIPPIVIGMKWFPNHRSLVTALITMPPFVYYYLQWAFVNPHNLPVSYAYSTSNAGESSTINYCGFVFQREVMKNTLDLFMFLSVFTFTVTVIGVLLIKERTTDGEIIPLVAGDESSSSAMMSTIMNDENTRLMNVLVEMEISNKYLSLAMVDAYPSSEPEPLSVSVSVSAETPSGIITGTDTAAVDISWMNAFKTVQFWQLMLIGTFNMIGFSFMNAEWKVFAQEYAHIYNDVLLTFFIYYKQF